MISFDPIIEVVSPLQYDTMMREMRMAQVIGDTLAYTYPGYSWLVGANFTGGIATIEVGEINSEVLSNMSYKYVLHLHNLVDAGIARKKIIRAGGEMLERAYRPRRKWDGLYPTRVDGVKERHQPFAGKIISLDEYRRMRKPNSPIILAA